MIVVLPEDASEEVARRLVLHALQCVSEGLPTHRVSFHEPPRGLLELFRGRRWARRRYDRTTLVRALATELEQGRVVVAHFDADCAWPGPSRNEDEFRTRVLDPVSSRISTDRLVAMVPYPCIEAWTYRNVVHARALCVQHGLATTVHDAFASDPLRLDRTVGLQQDSPLRKAHNLALVQAGWPRLDAVADAQSFAAFVDRVRGVPGLLALLPAP